MPPTARQKLLDELIQGINQPSDYDLIVERLLDMIDESDQRLELAERDFATFKEAYIKRIDKIVNSIKALEHFVSSHKNLSEIWTIFNEAERTLFSNNAQIFSREIVGKLFHKIRKELFDILNPAAPLSLSAAGGQSTDGEVNGKL